MENGKLTRKIIRQEAKNAKLNFNLQSKIKNLQFLRPSNGWRRADSGAICVTRVKEQINRIYWLWTYGDIDQWAPLSCPSCASMFYAMRAYIQGNGLNLPWCGYNHQAPEETSGLIVSYDGSERKDESDRLDICPHGSRLINEFHWRKTRDWSSRFWICIR